MNFLSNKPKMNDAELMQYHLQEDKRRGNFLSRSSSTPEQRMSDEERMKFGMTGDVSPYSDWTKDWEDMGILEKTFDVLSRGQYASANVVRGLLEGDSNVISNAWAGLSGEQKGDFIDILRSYGIDWAPILGTALNIGLDPFTYLSGPIALMKKSKMAKGVKGALVDGMNALKNVTPGGKELGTVVDWIGHAFDPRYKLSDDLYDFVQDMIYTHDADVVDAHKQVLKLLGNITDEQKKIVTKARLTGEMPKDKETLKLAQKAFEWFDEATRTALQYGIIDESAIREYTVNGVSRYLPVIHAEHLHKWNGRGRIFGAELVPMFSHERTTELTILDWKDLANDFDDLAQLDSVEAIRKKAAELVMDSSHKYFDKNAAKRVMTAIQDGDNVKEVKGILKKWSIDHTPVENFDELMALYQIELSGPVKQEQILDYVLHSADEVDNWRSVYRAGDDVQEGFKTVARKHKVKARAKAVLKSDASDEAKRHAGMVLKTIDAKKTVFRDLVELTQREADIVAKDIGSAVFSLDDEVLQYLGRGEKLFGSISDTATKQVVQFYDKMLGGWKKFATIWRLPFHVRNAVTNQIRMMQAGMNIADLGKYGTLAARVQKGGDEIIEIGKYAHTADDWQHIFASHGVRGWGFVGEFDPSKFDSAKAYEEALQNASELIKGESSVLKRVMGLPDKIGGRLAHIIEDNARISVASWRLDKMLDEGAGIAKYTRAPRDAIKTAEALKKHIKSIDADIDYSIAQQIDDLNKAGYKTVQSVSGVKASANPKFDYDRATGFITFNTADKNKQEAIIQAAKKAGLQAERGSSFMQKGVTVRIPPTKGTLSSEDIQKLAKHNTEEAMKDKFIKGKLPSFTRKEWAERFNQNVEQAMKYDKGEIFEGVKDADRQVLQMWNKFTEELTGKKYKLNTEKEDMLEAAKWSWKYLFQYDQLTDMEQNFMKRLIPFYTWTRKNLELQAEMLITNPIPTKKANQIYNALRAWSPDTPEDKRVKADWMENLGYFKVPQGIVDGWAKLTDNSVQKGRTVYANIDMPWNELANLENPLRTFMSSLTPAALIFNIGLNAKNFPSLGEPIEKFKGELVPAPFGATLIPEFAWGALNMKPMQNKDGQEVLGISAKALTALYNAFPFMQELNRMFPGTYATIEDKEKSPWYKLRYLTGIHFRPESHDMETLYQDLERTNKLAQVGRLMSLRGRALEQDELEEILQSDW